VVNDGASSRPLGAPSATEVAVTYAHPWPQRGSAWRRAD